MQTNNSSLFDFVAIKDQKFKQKLRGPYKMNLFPYLLSFSLDMREYSQDHFFVLWTSRLSVCVLFVCVAGY